MKKILLQILALGVVAGAMWFAGERYGAHTQEIKNTPPTTAATAPLPLTHPNPAGAANHSAPPLLAANEWPKFARARQAALQADPDLDTEYKQILKKLDAQQAKLDAAMIEADPQIKPVIAKLVVLRQKNSVPLISNLNSGALVKSAAPAVPPVALTQDDLQQIRTARATALQTNPTLITNAKAISEQMRDYENKLDAAMIKIDPSVSPIIAKFDGAHKSPGISATPSSVK